jgi:hypothetical protein
VVGRGRKPGEASREMGRHDLRRYHGPVVSTVTRSCCGNAAPRSNALLRKVERADLGPGLFDDFAFLIDLLVAQSAFGFLLPFEPNVNYWNVPIRPAV